MEVTMKWLELELANGNGLDIPAHSILAFEQLSPGKVPQWPNANTFIRFDYGMGMQQEALNTTIGELERLVKKAQPSDQPDPFVKLTNSDGTDTYFRKEGITGLKGIKFTEEELAEVKDPDAKHIRCQVAVNLSGQLINFFVREENHGIKILMGERPAVRRRRRQQNDD
jgi:hypothetical protein